MCTHVSFHELFQTMLIQIQHCSILHHRSLFSIRIYPLPQGETPLLETLIYHVIYFVP